MEKTKEVIAMQDKVGDLTMEIEGIFNLVFSLRNPLPYDDVPTLSREALESALLGIELHLERVIKDLKSICNY